MYRLMVDGIDVTQQISKYINKIELIDNAGIEHDTLTITLADNGNNLPVLQNGQVVTVALGQDLVSCGQFIVSGTTYSGPPALLTTTCKAVDVTKTLTTVKQYSFVDITINDVAHQIAASHGLKAMVDDAIKEIIINRLQNESDLHFLTSIAADLGVVFKIADGFLILAVSDGTTIKGSPLQLVNIQAKTLRDWHFAEISEGADLGVTARYVDDASGETRLLRVGKEPYSALQRTYTSKTDALKAAQAKLAKQSSQAIEGDLKLSKGNAYISVGSPISISGLHPAFTGIQYKATEVRHKIGARGFTTAVKISSI